MMYDTECLDYVPNDLPGTNLMVLVGQVLFRYHSMCTIPETY